MSKSEAVPAFSLGAGAVGGRTPRSTTPPTCTSAAIGDGGHEHKAMSVLSVPAASTLAIPDRRRRSSGPQRLAFQGFGPATADRQPGHGSQVPATNLWLAGFEANAAHQKLQPCFLPCSFGASRPVDCQGTIRAQLETGAEPARPSVPRFGSPGWSPCSGGLGANPDQGVSRSRSPSPPGGLWRFRRPARLRCRVTGVEQTTSSLPPLPTAVQKLRGVRPRLKLGKVSRDTAHGRLTARSALAAGDGYGCAETRMAIRPSAQALEG